MACQNARGERRAPGNWARSVQSPHRHPTCDPTWKKVRISHHRNCQGPYQAPEAAIRSAWEEAYADLKWLRCYILQESPLQKHCMLKACCQNNHARRITKDVPSSGLLETCYHCYHRRGGSRTLYDRTEVKQVAPVQDLCSMAMWIAKSWQDTPRIGHINAVCGLAHSYSLPGTWFQDAASKFSAKEHQISSH